MKKIGNCEINVDNRSWRPRAFFLNTAHLQISPESVRIRPVKQYLQIGYENIKILLTRDDKRYQGYAEAEIWCK